MQADAQLTRRNAGRIGVWPADLLKLRWDLAAIQAEATGKPSAAVLFSGQAALPPLLERAASYTVGPLVLLVACKGLAYAVSLSSFRGGPTFPGMFLGASWSTLDVGRAQSRPIGCCRLLGRATGGTRR